MREDHAASVIFDSDGKMYVKEQLINVADGFKKDKLISVIPSNDEKIETWDTPHVRYLFKDLSHMNLILTNACNLSCSYCYEQHRQDFGRFTVESLKTAYDWLNTINEVPNKNFQFFGGEPLIHKKLILDFIEEHDEELASNYDNYDGTYISMCSNGILVDQDFVDAYFSKSYTHFMMSLDTFDLENDHREITPKQLDKIVDNIERIIKKLGDEPQRLVIRTTLSEESSGTMDEFVERLYKAGVRSLVVHPLVLDATQGYIDWKPENWENMRKGIFDALYKYHDLKVRFSEGVGTAGENNCMVGSDMIAIDASGDYSGCYFFTNMKADAGVDGTILGNVFNNEVYTDRYKKFLNIYTDLFTHEQCQACDLQDYCYQCPAGNLSTGSKEMFRPDDMCQKIVQLYLDFKIDIQNKEVIENTNLHLERLQQQGYSYIEKILTDFGLSLDYGTKHHYVEFCNKNGFEPMLLEEDNEYAICFYAQLLILLRP